MPLLQESLLSLWEEWQNRSVELATHPNLPNGRLTSLAHSISLSLQSPRLHSEGPHLFRLLGQLPCGIALRDRIPLLGHEAYEAQHQLLATGLAVSRNGRIVLLPPIRAFAQAMEVPQASEMKRLLGHYQGIIAASGWRILMRRAVDPWIDLQLDCINLESASLTDRASQQLKAFIPCPGSPDYLLIKTDAEYSIIVRLPSG